MDAELGHALDHQRAGRLAEAEAVFVTLSFHPKKVVPPLFHVCVASMIGVFAVTVPPTKGTEPLPLK